MLRASLFFTVLAVGLVAGLAAPATAQRQAVSDSALAVRAEQTFVRGMTRAYLGDYDAAIELYERALELQPGEGAFLAALAEAHEAEGDLTTALFFAALAVEASPEEASTYRHLAGLQLVAGETDAALATYQRLLEIAPRDVRALTALARIQQQAGRFDDALATYDRILREVGESSAVRTRMYRIYQRLGDISGTIRSLQALVDLDPANVTLQRELAGLYEREGRTNDAIAVLEDFLASHPQHAEALRDLATLYRSLGNDDRADALTAQLDAWPATPDAMRSRATDLYLRADEDPEAAATARDLLESVVEAGAADAASLLMLGDLRYRAGDWDAAADALAPALEDDPSNIAAWAQLVAARLQAGDVDAAVDAADEATLLFPGQYALIRIAALAHTQAENNRDALDLFEEALALLAENDPEADAERSALLAYVGLLHARMDAPARADAAYTEALELDRDNGLALDNYASLLAERGERLDEALAMARRAVDLDGESASYLDTLGWVHYQRGDYDVAVEWLTEAVAAGEPTATLLEHLGDAEAARGRLDAARRHWQAALDLDAGNERIEAKLRNAP
jgi:tetratricopeptide (TPR) repeat protein